MTPPDHVEWVPGDPLVEWDPRPHMNVGLYNFRIDADRDECYCHAAADWPGQIRKALPHGDELGAFVEDYRRWEAQQGEVA